MQIPARAAQMQAQNAVLVLAARKGHVLTFYLFYPPSLGVSIQMLASVSGLCPWALRGCVGSAALLLVLQSSAAAQHLPLLCSNGRGTVRQPNTLEQRAGLQKDSGNYAK